MDDRKAKMSDGTVKENSFEERLTGLGESEMAMFRFLLDRPAGVILTVGTDKILAELLERESLVLREPGDKVIIPDEVRKAYEELDPDDVTLKWRKRNWMYKCLEAGKYLYGVMTWDALKDMFALRYPEAGMDEVKRLFETTPVYYRWFTERDGKLVLNGFEKNDYYKYLEEQVQGDIPFYVPTKEEVEELYEQGSLISRESHQKLKAFLETGFGMDPDTASLKLHDLYETVNNHMRVNDAVDRFLAGSGDSEGPELEFESDEQQFRFIELYMEMSRECRIRDNRGHDNYEMVAIMALENRGPASTGGTDASLAGAAKRKPLIKPAKIGRNDPCPCGSGKKYKNCCGRNSH